MLSSLVSRDPLALAFQSGGITGISHRAQPKWTFLNLILVAVQEDGVEGGRKIQIILETTKDKNLD